MWNRKFGRNADHRKAMLRNLATSVILYGKVETTEAKAKDLRSVVDKMITLGKKGDLHSIRQAASILKKYNVANKPEALTKLFKDLSTRFASRNGGYLKVYKLENRKGDNAEVRMLTLAD